VGHSTLSEISFPSVPRDWNKDNKPARGGFKYLGRVSLATTSIADEEIRLIKALLERGMKPSMVQAYFTRPNRLVNPARIQEVRKGELGGDLSPADDQEVDAFLTDFANKFSNFELDSPPKENPSATHFVLRDGLLDSVEETPTENGIASELYIECREKLISLCQNGGNVLGNALGPAQSMLEAMPESELDANIYKIWMRLNTLRSVASSVTSAEADPEAFPVYTIADGAVPLLIDAVESLNVFCSFSTQLRDLDSRRVPAEEASIQKEALERIEVAFRDARSITTDRAYASLNDQLSEAFSIDETGDSRRIIDLADKTSQNFLTKVFETVFNAARSLFPGETLRDISKKMRDGAAIEAGRRISAKVAENYPLILNYIKEYAGTMTEYVQTTMSSEALKEFVQSLLSLLM